MFFTDVGECAQESNDCHVNATCNNTEGSYNYWCKNGFTGDGCTCEGENFQVSCDDTGNAK